MSAGTLHKLPCFVSVLQSSNSRCDSFVSPCSCVCVCVCVRSLKGTCAYAAHAEALGGTDPAIYDDVQKTYAFLSSPDAADINKLLGHVSKYISRPLPPSLLRAPPTRHTHANSLAHAWCATRSKAVIQGWTV